MTTEPTFPARFIVYGEGVRDNRWERIDLDVPLPEYSPASPTFLSVGASALGGIDPEVRIFGSECTVKYAELPAQLSDVQRMPVSDALVGTADVHRLGKLTAPPASSKSLSAASHAHSVSADPTTVARTDQPTVTTSIFPISNSLNASSPQAPASTLTAVVSSSADPHGPCLGQFSTNGAAPVPRPSQLTGADAFTPIPQPSAQSSSPAVSTITSTCPLSSSQPPTTVPTTVVPPSVPATDLHPVVKGDIRPVSDAEQLAEESGRMAALTAREGADAPAIPSLGGRNDPANPISADEEPILGLSAGHSPSAAGLKRGIASQQLLRRKSLAETKHSPSQRAAMENIVLKRRHDKRRLRNSSVLPDLPSSLPKIITRLARSDAVPDNATENLPVSSDAVAESALVPGPTNPEALTNLPDASELASLDQIMAPTQEMTTPSVAVEGTKVHGNVQGVTPPQQVSSVVATKHTSLRGTTYNDSQPTANALQNEPKKTRHTTTKESSKEVAQSVVRSVDMDIDTPEVSPEDPSEASIDARGVPLKGQTLPQQKMGISTTPAIHADVSPTEEFVSGKVQKLSLSDKNGDSRNSFSLSSIPGASVENDVDVTRSVSDANRTPLSEMDKEMRQPSNASASKKSTLASSTNNAASNSTVGHATKQVSSLSVAEAKAIANRNNLEKRLVEKRDNSRVAKNTLPAPSSAVGSQTLPQNRESTQFGSSKSTGSPVAKKTTHSDVSPDMFAVLRHLFRTIGRYNSKRSSKRPGHFEVERMTFLRSVMTRLAEKNGERNPHATVGSSTLGTAGLSPAQARSDVGKATPLQGAPSRLTKSRQEHVRGEETEVSVRRNTLPREGVSKPVRENSINSSSRSLPEGDEATRPGASRKNDRVDCLKIIKVVCCKFDAWKNYGAHDFERNFMAIAKLMNKAGSIGSELSNIPIPRDEVRDEELQTWLLDLPKIAPLIGIMWTFITNTLLSLKSRHRDTEKEKCQNYIKCLSNFLCVIEMLVRCAITRISTLLERKGDEGIALAAFREVGSQFQGQMKGKGEKVDLYMNGWLRKMKKMLPRHRNDDKGVTLVNDRYGLTGDVERVEDEVDALRKYCAEIGKSRAGVAKEDCSVGSSVGGRGSVQTRSPDMMRDAVPRQIGSTRYDGDGNRSAWKRKSTGSIGRETDDGKMMPAKRRATDETMGRSGDRNASSVRKSAESSGRGNVPQDKDVRRRSRDGLDVDIANLGRGRDGRGNGRGDSDEGRTGMKNGENARGSNQSLPNNARRVPGGIKTSGNGGSSASGDGGGGSSIQRKKSSATVVQQMMGQMVGDKKSAQGSNGGVGGGTGAIAGSLQKRSSGPIISIGDVGSKKKSGEAKRVSFATKLVVGSCKQDNSREEIESLYNDGYDLLGDKNAVQVAAVKERMSKLTRGSVFALLGYIKRFLEGIKREAEHIGPIQSDRMRLPYPPSAMRMIQRELGVPVAVRNVTGTTQVGPTVSVMHDGLAGVGSVSAVTAARPTGALGLRSAPAPAPAPAQAPAQAPAPPSRHPGTPPQ